MSGEVWTFEAEVGPMLNKIRQITNEQQILERQIKSNAETAQRGSALAQQAVEQDLVASYKLTQQKKNLFAELQKLETQQKQSIATQAAVTAGTSKSQMVIQQLAYAADDAAVSFGNGGLSGALRGASNNLSAVAMAFNPVYGAIAGVGLAIGGVFLRRWEELEKATDGSKESLDRWRESASQTRKVIADLAASTEELSGNEQKAAEMRLQRRRMETLEKPKTELTAAQQKVGDASERIRQIDERLKEGPRPGESSIYRWILDRSLKNERSALVEQRDADQLEVDRQQRNLALMENLFDQEESARQQKAGRDRIGAFTKQVRRNVTELAGGLQKGFAERVKQLDPLQLQLNDVRIQTKRAQIAADEERVRASGPARPQFAGDREGFVTPAESDAIKKLDQAAQALQIAAGKIELAISERERDRNINRRPGG